MLLYCRVQGTLRQRWFFPVHIPCDIKARTLSPHTNPGILSKSCLKKNCCLGAECTQGKPGKPGKQRKPGKPGKPGRPGKTGEKIQSWRTVTRSRDGTIDIEYSLLQVKYIYLDRNKLMLPPSIILKFFLNSSEK